jgi:GDPmannose 4,6-dehydratase
VDARGIDQNTGKVIVRVNPAFYRPAEVDFLLGDAAKAKERLGWAPKVRFDELVEMMARADMDRAARGELQPLNF